MAIFSNSVDRATDEIDAAIFSGDEFVMDPARVAELRRLMARWERAMVDFERDRLEIESEDEAHDRRELEAARKAGPLKVIHLKDNGQDFLRFMIDSNNVIQRTEPCQGWMWDGRELDGLIVGEYPLISNKGNTGWTHLYYKVEAITDDQPSDA